MRNLFLLTCLSIFSLSFGQKQKTKFVNLPKETLYKMFANSAAAKETYKTETEAERKKRFNQYYCMIKTYKRDFSKDSNFTDRETAKKNVKEDFKLYGIVAPESMNAVESQDNIYKLQMTSYENRLSFYNENKKCLKKANFDW